jgi:NAD(P)H-nitrite reductase large subunit
METICECELASRDEVVHAITAGEAKTIDDVRRDVRLGMGPCQEGLHLRVAGLCTASERSRGRERSLTIS